MAELASPLPLLWPPLSYVWSVSPLQRESCLQTPFTSEGLSYHMFGIVCGLCDVLGHV